MSIANLRFYRAHSIPAALVVLCSILALSGCGSASTTLNDSAGAGDSLAGSAGTTASSAGQSSGGELASSGGPGEGASAGSAAGGSGHAGDAGGASSGCNQPTITKSTACNNQYPQTTIAAIRKAKAAGCFELSHVGLTARTDSPTEPRLYVQDIGGADGSAMLSKCTTTATHACDPAVKAKIPRLYDTLTDAAQLSIRGYYQVGALSGFEEFYIEDIIDECKQVARPAPIVLSASDLTRDARAPSKWFRRATVNIPANDPLVVYDFSPPELLLGQPQCPDYAGFAMIQKSAGTAAPAACSGAMNPAPRAMADAKEVLIGRQFFNQFLFAADCACASTSNLRIVNPSGSVSGSVLGYLILEQDKGSTTAYQVFEPAADQTFPIH